LEEVPVEAAVAGQQQDLLAVALEITVRKDRRALHRVELEETQEQKTHVITAF
jgi:hypothetical protein